jgi:phospholipid/cholesterol/gamma-HCH transport system substrate-binding protein
MARSTVVSHETAVGAFAILVVAILGGLLVVKGARVGFGSRQVVFTSDASNDLKLGATVKMQGIEVGEVSEVSLLKDNKVEVRLKVFPEYRDNVKTDSVAFIENPIIGSGYVDLRPGVAATIADGDRITGHVDSGIMGQVQESKDDLKKLLVKVNSIADKADGTLGTVAAMVSRVNAGEGLVGRLMNDEKLADELVSGVRGVTQVVQDVKDGKGAFALLKDETLGPDIKQAVADVRSMTDAIARGDGTLGRLMTSSTLATEGEGVLKDVRGALARLDQISKDTTATTAKVQEVLGSAKGTLDKLDGTIKNAEKITGELAQVTEKINKGQGTLAKLVNDDAIFKETKALLKELRESVEDLREQAPINSFIGVVFSAF